jgi:hypothetical protein
VTPDAERINDGTSVAVVAWIEDDVIYKGGGKLWSHFKALVTSKHVFPSLG